MKSIDIRNTFLEYFKNHNHAIIPSASVVPENDSSVLFTTAGMQPLVPYLMGKEHPAGKRLCDYQKCIRTVDIDEVGDNSHLTFFEMLGNWSLGDYFKKESITMSYDLLVNHLHIPKEKLSVTCFEGNEDIPKDEISANLWKEMGIPEDRIYFFGMDDNFWIAGTSGPCGPDTEIFYDTGKEKCSANCNPSCDCGKYLEIWNNVFMEYFKDENGKYTPLKHKNVDTGMGLERITYVLQGLSNPYETETFAPCMEFLYKKSGKNLIQSRRIICDHLRAIMIMITDGVYPSNTDRGYIVRRLLRRAVRHLFKLGIQDSNDIKEVLDVMIDSCKELYPEIEAKKDEITNVILTEKEKFGKTLIKGEKELEKILEKNDGKINEEQVFKLYETYGLPVEISIEYLREKEIALDEEKIHNLFKAHQEKSRAGSQDKFKGGLLNHDEKTIQYHTATHLLHKALKEILGDSVWQKGSNITPERLRFDFSYDTKLTKEQLEQVENLVNEQIQRNLDVTSQMLPYDEAKKQGAIGLFTDKYDDTVSVYKIGDFSLEMCGGPHVKNTKELGKFKITKEEASSKGVRRIKAILEDKK